MFCRKKLAVRSKQSKLKVSTHWNAISDLAIVKTNGVERYSHHLSIQ